MEKAYTDAIDNIASLDAMGVSCYHKVDATKLEDSKEISDQKFDVIVWNFPCFADKEGADAQSALFEVNKVHT